METYNYFPILRTKDAELNGFAELSEKAKTALLPIFELTRGRRTKKDKVGDVNKRIDRILELVDGGRFILDLTTDPRASNKQIDNMLHDSGDGFKEWRTFLSNLNTKQCIPIIHYNPNALPEVRRQIVELLKLHQHLAFRINSDNPEFINYVDQILAYIQDPKRLILIVDAGFVAISQIEAHKTQLTTLINTLKRFPNKICAVSGFPSSVTRYGADDTGNFRLAEVEIGEHLVANTELRAYCDYSSIHPIPFEAFGGWVPRVDFPLDRNCYYYRYREVDGGYEKAATDVLADDLFRTIAGNWGINQIRSAAGGLPEGRSPSHWIAVRVNIHLTRQSNRVRGLNGIQL